MFPVQRLTSEQFAKFQSLIYQHSGIRLDDRKVTLLSSRLQRRLRELEITDPDEYYALVTSRRGKDEQMQLLDAVTTNETFFFRTESHFDWFSDVFLPEIDAQHRAGQRKSQLRVWSAACSSGAEPYSLAFCIDAQRPRWTNWDITIIATDLSNTSLQQARTGQYKQRMMENVPATKVSRYFNTTDDSPTEYLVKDAFRSLVQFEHHNLMHPKVGPKFDCIFLRNVLIYFDEASKQTVLNHVVASLAEGGYLVIGPSEGIYGLDNPLTKLSTFLYRNESPSPKRSLRR